MKSKHFPLLVYVMCAIFLLLSQTAFAETPETGASVFYNPDGGRYYHTTQQCDTIHEKYHSALRMVSLEDVDLFQRKIIPCPACFGTSLRWIGEEEAEEAVPFLDKHLRLVYGESAHWKIEGWKLSALQNVLQFHILIEGDQSLDIIMAKAHDGWFPIVDPR